MKPTSNGGQADCVPDNIRRVLIGHNAYRTRGGEDTVVETEAAILRSRGHDVVLFQKANAAIDPGRAVRNLRLGLEAIWSQTSYRQLTRLLRERGVRVAHFHNLLPQISPAAYYACREAGVPVIQTLHNYRLLCAAGTLFRDGSVCEECVSHGSGRALRYRCYRGSWRATCAVVAMVEAHKWLGTWRECVDVYIALSAFSRALFVKAGVPADRIVIRPNCVYPDPGVRGNDAGAYAVFVGRLSEEKGVRLLLKAWETGHLKVPLLVIGTGPLEGEMRRQVQERCLGAVRLIGRCAADETMKAVKGARFVVCPSEWFECCPMVVLEAFACGVPVVCSSVGALTELVENGRTGLHCAVGSAQHLASVVEWAWNHPSRMIEMGREARCVFEAKYSVDCGYRKLLEIYQMACGRRKAS